MATIVDRWRRVDPGTKKKCYGSIWPGHCPYNADITVVRELRTDLMSASGFYSFCDGCARRQGAPAHVLS